jgi:hypothetical protein
MRAPWISAPAPTWTDHDLWDSDLVLSHSELLDVSAQFDIYVYIHIDVYIRKSQLNSLSRGVVAVHSVHTSLNE